MSGTVDVVVFVTIEGDDFEIVGHAFPSGEGPAPVEPEDAAAAPAAPDQLAALPSQPEATVAALAESGEEPSLDAVERLLSEREVAFRQTLQAYLDRHGLLGAPVSLSVVRVLEAEVLGIDGDAYRLRVLFNGYDPGMTSGAWSRAANFAEEITVLLAVNGVDFEIVGHEVPSGEGRGQAAARSGSNEFEAVERMLRARQEAFRLKLRDYNDTHQIEPVQYQLGRSFRLY